MTVRKMIVATAISFALAGTAWADDHGEDEVQIDLHAKAKAALTDHEGLAARDINIEVEDGIVQISGFVNDAALVAAADDLLGDMEGMAELRNHLVVYNETAGTEANIDNTALAAKVKAAMLTDDTADADEVLVEVRDGRVLLAGFVDNDAEREAAEAAAAGVEGVAEVINKIDIASQSD